MASLYDLAMQYLNQSLPETFKYDRTNQPGTLPPVTLPPQDPNAPTARILPMPGGGGGGFNPYNPDPNSISNKNYSPYAYRQAAAKSGVGIPSGILSDSEFLYGPQLTGIPGAIANYAKNSLVGKGLDALGNMMPVNQRAILENELLGSGFRLNDIGQIVSDGGDYDTAGNVMSGYNTSKMTEKTFDDRIASLGNMTPEGRAKRTAAILEAKQNFIDAKNKTTTVFDDKSLAKDPDYVSFDDQLNANNIINTEKEDDELLDYTNPNIYNTNSIYTQTAPTYTTDPYVSGQDDKDIGTTPPGTFDGTPDYYGGVGDSVIDAGGTAPGGGYTSDYYGGVGDSVIDAGGTAPGGGYATDYYGGGNDSGSSYNAGSGYNATGKGGPAGQGSSGLGDYQVQPSTPSYTPSPGDNGSGGNNSGGKSIVCTAMYQTTGLEDWSKAMKIWYIYQKKYLTIEHQEGYHKLFKPFVKGMHKSKIIKDIGAHVAKHRTQDLKHIMFGSKPSWLGRVYRKILEPICYFVGKYV